MVCDLSAQQIADAMTAIGIEVDSVSRVEAVEGGLDGVVVAEVLECVDHPDSDHLHITKVDDGSGEILTVICGAANVAAGQKVLFARIGTTLPGIFKIRKSKIRGVESMGMICAEDELGIGSSHEGIMVLPGDAVVGTPAKEHLGLVSDDVIEYELTANRIDASSHIGVARDLYAYLRLRDIPCSFAYPSAGAGKIEAPACGLAAPSSTASLAACEKISGASPIPVAVEDENAAPVYIGTTIRGVKVAPSPKWLQDKLLAIGLRPINNIVDISNYILFEQGQPLHTFDADKISGGKVVVRRAAAGEPLVTLDGVERKLDSSDIVIADESKPMCLAGVFGGRDSGVTDGTVNVFLETAYFDPGSIRKTSKRHGLQTDASYRYERSIDPMMQEYVAERAASLIVEVAGGRIDGFCSVTSPKRPKRAELFFDYEAAEAAAGLKIGFGNIDKILDLLGYKVLERKENGALVQVPSYMTDVTRQADVLEEVLRIYGYDNIPVPPVMRMSVNVRSAADAEKVRNSVSDFLAANGFMEIMNNSLTKKAYYAGLKTYPESACVDIVNPLSSDLNVMRQTLLLGALEVVAYNINRQCSDLRFFEYGSVYRKLDGTDGRTLSSYDERPNFSMVISGQGEKSWRTGLEKGDYFQLKGYLQTLLQRYGIDIYRLESEAAPEDLFSEGEVFALPGSDRPLARIGAVSRKLLSVFGIKQAVYEAEIDFSEFLKAIGRVSVVFKELPKFPEVHRDLALLVDESAPYSAMRKAAMKAERKLLRSVSLFDVYRGEKIPEGKKQYAFSFILGNAEKTLTDADTDAAMSRILSALQKEFGATLR